MAASTMDMAEAYAKGALANYGRDGLLAPVCAVHAGEVVVFTLVNTDEKPISDNIGVVVAICGAATSGPLTHVVVLAESWIRTTHEGDPIARNIERGSLEKMRASGDSLVHTALTIYVFDVLHPEQTVMLSYDVEDNYRRCEHVGVGHGAIAEAARRGAEVAELTRGMRPAEYGVKDAAMSLINNWQVATAAALQEVR